jgi:ATP-binding cassette subfamily B protein
MNVKKPGRFDWDLLEANDFPKKPAAAIAFLFKGLRWRLAGAVVVYAVKHSPVWIMPIATAAVVNAAAAGLADPAAAADALSRIGWICVGMLLLFAQNIPTHTLYAWLLNGAIRKMEARTRMSLLRRLQELSFSFHEASRSGALQAKILRDVEAVGMMTSQLVNTVLSTAITIAVSVGWSLAKQPTVAVFYAVFVPAAVLLVQLFYRRLGVNARAYRREIEDMNASVAESLEMLPVTRAHAGEDAELNRISAAIARVAASGKRMDIFNGVFGATSWAVFQSFSLGCLAFSAVLAIRGRVPIGDVVLYQGFFVSIVNGLNGVLNALPDLSRGLASVASIGEVLTYPERENDAGKLGLAKVEGGFRFEDVVFKYPGAAEDTLRGFAAEIAPGERVAVVGESGSGKSTLMGLIIGYLKPTGGRILLDGEDLRHVRLHDFRRRLSVVGQNVILFSGSVRENIGYGLDTVPDDAIWEALRAANAEEFVRAMPEGLDAKLGEHGGKLSGGQRQRLAIARALLRDPRVLILDEATSALDSESERAVQSAVDRLTAGRTAFIVAHRLSTVRGADRILVLSEGRIAESGTYAELAAAGGIFARLASAYV